VNNTHSQQSFETAGSQFLDKAMPLPVVLTCAYVVAGSAHPWLAAIVSVLFVAGNIALNVIIKRRIERGEEPGRALDGARAGLSLLLLPPLAWLGGPTTEAWVVALPAIVAVPYLLSFGAALAAEVALIVLVLGAWQHMAGPTMAWLVPGLAMLAVAMVTAPVAEAMRQRGKRLAVATENLRRATAAAQAASSAKSSFLAHMSHELRTPLAAITGYGDLLSDPRVSADEREQATQVIQRNSAHLVDLVNQVLDLAKIEAGELLVESVPVDVQAVVEDVASLMRVQSNVRGLEFGIEYATRVPERLHSDPLRLKQVLLNLMGNAVKFTRKGRVRIRVALAEGNRELRLEVIDSGIGVDKARLESLFQPFVQADASTARVYGGTGLGLTISRQLAELMGGRLEAESTVDVGSCFRLILPVSADEAAGLRDPARGGLRQASKPQAVHQLDLTDVSVLLAEDFADSGRLIALHLERAGASVELVDNGGAALHAVREAAAGGQAFDMILMDMQMPVLDGYAATSRLRADGHGGPVIALTAHAMAGDRERCLAAGCDGYVTKPVDFAVLLSAMADLLPEAASRQVEADECNEHEQARPAAEEILARALAVQKQQFEERLPDRIAELQSSWQAGDRQGVAAIAHKLAGSAGMYGLTTCGDHARALETAISSGTDDLEPLVSALCQSAVVR